jgi:hypothetical protein
MTRLMLRKFTGKSANNPIVAHRVARKLRGAQRRAQCILVDCEGVDVAEEFLTVLLEAAVAGKVKFCGLPIDRQVNSMLDAKQVGDQK